MLKDFPETEQQQMTSLLKRLGVELDKATTPQIVEQAL
jgi:hypothetical protein